MWDGDGWRDLKPHHAMSYFHPTPSHPSFLLYSTILLRNLQSSHFFLSFLTIPFLLYQISIPISSHKLLPSLSNSLKKPLEVSRHWTRSRSRFPIPGSWHVCLHLHLHLHFGKMHHRRVTSHSFASRPFAFCPFLFLLTISGTLYWRVSGSAGVPDHVREVLCIWVCNDLCAGTVHCFLGRVLVWLRPRLGISSCLAILPRWFDVCYVVENKVLQDIRELVSKRNERIGVGECACLRMCECTCM